MVLWHGWSCKEMCGTILWVDKQHDSTTLHNINSMPWRPSFQRRRLEIHGRLVKSMRNMQRWPKNKRRGSPKFKNLELQPQYQLKKKHRFRPEMIYHGFRRNEIARDVEKVTQIVGMTNSFADVPRDSGHTSTYLTWSRRHLVWGVSVLSDHMGHPQPTGTHQCVDPPRQGQCANPLAAVLLLHCTELDTCVRVRPCWTCCQQHTPSVEYTCGESRPIQLTLCRTTHLPIWTSLEKEMFTFLATHADPFTCNINSWSSSQSHVLPFTLSTQSQVLHALTSQSSMITHTFLAHDFHLEIRSAVATVISVTIDTPLVRVATVVSNDLPLDQRTVFLDTSFVLNCLDCWSLALYRQLAHQQFCL